MYPGPALGKEGDRHLPLQGAVITPTCIGRQGSSEKISGQGDTAMYSTVETLNGNGEGHHVSRMSRYSRQGKAQV